MTFNDNAQLDTSGVTRGRRGAAVGGGLGGFGLIGVILYVLITGQLPDLGQAYEAPGNQQEQHQGQSLEEQCRTGADANSNVECRMVAGKNSIDAFWNAQTRSELGIRYQPASLNLFSGRVSTACGGGSSQTGPFYCPGDQSIYIDVSFFDQLNRLGADNAPLAQLYILAHEYGHHMQLLTGDLNKIDHRSSGESSSMVRSELQADCLAGAWIHNAASTKDANGNAFMKQPTEAELRAAMDAAQAVGDDRIYENAGLEANPDNFSHGSAEKRMEWLLRGIKGGTYQTCDTWSVAKP
ncbi:KPN_02809 family neutral zinc metallopeptidase [Trueperella pecoris]|uniref:KPN_02809 family neutral zinc metallopeptidase n=1 Tax=Trueperella pecoris TaxID=2733571 RepID=UPI001ABDCD37|nr:neutral zinc metallopeptidase [Trueperella pecoris]QTG74664.1 neutral zinc metallopeptidase [Trueperella pecoris]